MSQVIRRIVVYRGDVQGVGFRATVCLEGRGLLVHGTVRNERNGTVRLDVEGPVADVDELLCRIATRMQDFIDRVDSNDATVQNRHGGLVIEY
jgi:acylphosphatase